MSREFSTRFRSLAALCGYLTVVSLAPAFAHEQQPSTASESKAEKRRGAPRQWQPIAEAPSLDDSRSARERVSHEWQPIVEPPSLDDSRSAVERASHEWQPIVEPPSLDDSRSALERASHEWQPVTQTPSTDDSAGDAEDRQCMGDVDHDGYVNYDDLWSLLRYWGACAASTSGVSDEKQTCPTDLDGDGQTEFSDLILVLGGWGQCIQTR